MPTRGITRDTRLSGFETPDELYGVYALAGEVLAYRQFTTEFPVGYSYDDFTDPDALRLGNLQLVVKDPYVGGALDDGDTWRWVSADKDEGNRFFIGNVFDLSGTDPSSYMTYDPSNPPALKKDGTKVRSTHYPNNVLFFEQGDFFWPPVAR
jgi:hypothetical protein